MRIPVAVAALLSVAVLAGCGNAARPNIVTSVQMHALTVELPKACRKAPDSKACLKAINQQFPPIRALSPAKAKTLFVLGPSRSPFDRALAWLERVLG